MNWKTIRAGILVVLVIVNVALFWMNRLEQDQLYSATDEDLQQVLALYEENGVDVDVLIHRENYPRAPLELGSATLLDRTLVETLLGDEYQTAYMDAQQTRYAKEGESILLDPANHSMEYTSDNVRWPLWEEDTLRSWADTEVARCVGDLTYTRIRESIGEETAFFVYCQIENGEYLFMNRMEITLEAEGHMSMLLVYYEPLGHESVTREIRPIDEMLYAVLREILEEEDRGETALVDIRYGYDLTDGECVYCLEFVLNGGKETIRMNAYTNERITE